MVRVSLKELKQHEKVIDAKLKGGDPLSAELDGSLQILLKKYSAKLYYYNASQPIEKLYSNKYDPGHLKWCQETHNAVQLMLNQPFSIFSNKKSEDIKYLSLLLDDSDDFLELGNALV
jgi:hypothetical protein